MNKINKLLKRLPQSPFKNELVAEIEELTLQRNQYKVDAKKYQWLLNNSTRWSWQPSRYSDELVSGFSFNDTGYLGYSFNSALTLAKKRTKWPETQSPAQKGISVTECKPHCDFNHPVQKGRATWYCPKCGRDYSLEYLCLYEAMQPSREEKYEPRSFTAGV